MCLRRKIPHKDQLYSSQEFNIWVRGSQRLTWKAAKYVTLRKIYKLWLFCTVVLVFLVGVFFFWSCSPYPDVPPIRLPSMNKTLGTPEFIIQENLYFGIQTEKENLFCQVFPHLCKHAVSSSGWSHAHIHQSSYFALRRHLQQNSNICNIKSFWVRSSTSISRWNHF